MKNTNQHYKPAATNTAAADAAPNKRHGISYSPEQRKHILKEYGNYRQLGLPAKEAAKRTGAAYNTILNWLKRWDERRNLYPDSRRPHRTHSIRDEAALREAVKTLRNQYHIGKMKIGFMLRREGWQVSDSTVGRILGYLLASKEVSELYWGKEKVPGGKRSRPYPFAVPLDKSMPPPIVPGERVQIDTMVVFHRRRPVYLFNAVDMVSRWSWTMLARRHDAKSAAKFLRKIVRESVGGFYPVLSVQTDRGCEYRGQFEQLCARMGMTQYIVKSPQDNGRVECANGTQRREHFNALPPARTLAELEAQCNAWMDFYNRGRPHLALNMQTPLQYLQSA